MKPIPILFTITLVMMILLAGCTQGPAGPGTVTPAVTTPGSGIANPAAVYCTQKGYGYEIRKNPDGSEYGVCILPGGPECDEWAYYRGTCPASTTITAEAGIANPSATFCVSKNHSYVIKEGADGSRYGVCVFPSGKSCDGWAYYHGECNETTAK